MQIKIDFIDNEYGGYDQSNLLVLPSQKRKTKIKNEQKQVTRILSKKQRKKLEKIVEKKRNKEERSSILEGLKSVQISNDELKNYTSISTTQTLGLKKRKQLEKFDLKLEKSGITNYDKLDDDTRNKISSLSGVSKRKRLALLNGYNEAESSDEERNIKKKKDYNVIGFDNESSSDSDNDEDDEEDDKNNNQEENKQEKKEKSGNEWKEEDITEKMEDDNEESIDQNSKLNEILKSKEILKQRVALPLPRKPAIYVHVERDPTIQAARLKLPILAEEQIIMETINENQIIILAGETGSGKTTQVPQFLYEAGYAEKKLIGITEPRRVAAISMSKRVAKEMNLSESEISYLIRFEGNVTDKTKIKFMTDGVLMKEIESDFMLSKYSVIILDEAHERSAYTDILIGLLSRIVPLRHKKENPLKLIIMSATLRVEDFTSNTKLFRNPPPVLKVEARQYPVTIHFQKRTPDDYIKEAFKKIVKIHTKLPEGGILIFVTGQQEVNYLMRKLRKAFPYYAKNDNDRKSGKPDIKKSEEKGNNDDELKDDFEFDVKRAIKMSKKAKKNLAAKISLPKINLDNYKLPSDDTDFDLLDDREIKDGELESENEDDDDLNDVVNIETTIKQPLWVLPLYSLLSSEKQSRVFEPPPAGCRLCVVSTNVAETSLTIPNIKYVVDCGRQKTRLYDKITGVSAFIVTFTSKASADQRAGRAGRVSAGHCYRLYSSAVFADEFEDFSLPDIQKKPVDDLMLQMKCMGIDKVVNFPFPSPPDLTQLKTAEKRLILLGALEEIPTKSKNGNTEESITKVTPLGHAISAFPVAPRFGKMLALSHQKNLLPYTVCLVAALSVQEVLLEVSPDANENISLDSVRTKWANKRKTWAGIGNSKLLGDPMVLLRAVGGSEYAGSQGKFDEFCHENGLRPKAITEIRKLRIQLTNEINLNIPNANLCVDPQMKPPTDLEAKFLRQILLTGMGDQVARKIPDDEIKDKDDRRKFKYAYRCSEMEEPVFMHSSSVLRKSQPEWVIYQEVYETQNGDTRKMFMRGITAIEPEWLLLYIPKLCNIKSIKEEPQPKYNEKDGKIYCYVDATFGKIGWELPLTEIEMPFSEKACRYFGMYFLNGDVFPKLLEYKQKLKVTPSTLLKTWSNLNSYVTNFVKMLISKQINSKRKLLDIWKTNKNCKFLNFKFQSLRLKLKKKSNFYFIFTDLLQQYTDLLYGIEICEMSLIWPPIEEENDD